MSQPPDAASLLRSVGLMADGPVLWGRPVPASGPGVFAIELPTPLATAPIDVSRVGKWIERVDTLRLDGERPTSKAVAARLAAFWLATQSVVYIGASDASVARRVAAIGRTELGDRRPNPSGHWLKTLRSLDGLRIWWAATDAAEEYEDALFTAFAEGLSAADLSKVPDADVLLPWANLRRSTGERKATGLTGTLLPDTAEPPAPPTHVVQLPDGDAEGARGEPAPAKRRAAPPAPRPAPRKAPALGGPPTGTTPAGVVPAEALTAEGEARLRAELDELTLVKRPQIIARIRTAKEHGDLKENAEYHAAREEQSFLEGRVQAIEGRLRSAVIVAAPVAGSRVGLGSVVTVDDDGDTVTYTIVGADESDPGRGRISSSSPVGRAFVGRNEGDDVEVVTPAGVRHYRILGIA
ncbi:MAG: transcription elongation factor GreA [Chloroflexota bacterium]